MKIAIVGLGTAGLDIHCKAYAKIDGLDVVGGVDLRAPQQKLDFPVYSSIEIMLDELKPDIVTVASPPSLHFSQCEIALESGCHVLCEKPFVDSLSEANRLVSLAEKHNRKIAINNEFRFMNIHQEAKAKIGSEDFGRLLFLDVRQTFFQDAKSRQGWRIEGNRHTCKEFGTHVFDLARYFFDSEPIRISARMPRPYLEQGPDHLNLIDLEFPNDCFARVTLDRLTRGRHRYLQMRLDGEQATVETRLGGSVGVHTGFNARSRRPYFDLELSFGGLAYLVVAEQQRKIGSDPLDLFPNATARLMTEFLKAIENDLEPPCSGKDNLRTLGLMLAAYEAAALGKAIDVEEYLNAALSNPAGSGCYS